MKLLPLPSPLPAFAAPLWLAAALFLGCPAAGSAQLPGTVDPGFAPSLRVDGTATVIVTQADGRQLIGGDFSRVGAAAAPSLARLNTDGSLDAGFTPPAGLGTVAYAAAAPGGKTAVLYDQSAAATSGFGYQYALCRLNADGSRDASFAAVPFGTSSLSLDALHPFVLAVQADGKVLVGGGFGTDPNSSVNVYTVRRYNADGSSDGGFQFPGKLSGHQIDSLLPLPNGQLLVSGSFTDQSTANFANVYLLRLNADGSRDAGYPAPNSQVGPSYALTLQPDGKLLYLAAQSVNSYSGGVPRRLNADGSPDATFAQAFSTGTSGGTEVDFNSLALQPDGKVVVGGYAAVISPPMGGLITVQTGVARVNADGTLDASFQPPAPPVDGTVAALGVQPNGQILVGGQFKTLAGTLHSSLGRLNADGSPDAAFSRDLTNAGQGYAVGVTAGGQALVASSGPLVNGVLASSLVGLRADGALLTVFAASLASSQFYDTGGSTAPANPVLAVQADGKVLLAGVFEPFSGNYVPGLRRYNPDGSVDSSFTSFPYYYAAFTSLAPQPDGHIYVAGALAAGYNRLTYPLDRFNADGSLDTGFQPATDPGATVYQTSSINSLAVQPDGKVLAAGYFLAPNRQPQTGILRFNADGSLDAGFRAGVFTTPQAGRHGVGESLALQPDGRIVIAGYFSAIGGVPANNVARLNADGSVDASFNAGADTGISLAVLQLDGKIVLAGGFSTVNGAARAGIARLNRDGSVDPQFTPGAGTGGTGAVNSVALTPDGSVLVGGTFTQFGGHPRDGVARLFGGDIPPAPVITSPATATGQVGQAFAYQLAASNRPTSFAAAGLPPGLGINPATGIISGTPTAAGTFAVALSAANLGGTGTATLTLTVLPAAPVVSGGAAAAQATVPFRYQIAAANSPTGFAAAGLPPGLGVDAASGVISGTPTAAGIYPVALSAANAGGTGTATLTITVAAAPVVAPAITSAPAASAQAGVAFAYQITATHAPTGYAAAGLPLGLSVNPATGLISGTPTRAGTFNVTLSAVNSGGTGMTTLALTVAPPTVLLAATVPTVAAGSGQAGVFTVTLSAPQTQDVSIRYTIQGSAVNGVDYVLLLGTKKIKAGQTSRPIRVLPFSGAAGKAVKLTLAPGDGYTVGTAGKVKVKITGP